MCSILKSNFRLYCVSVFIVSVSILVSAAFHPELAAAQAAEGAGVTPQDVTTGGMLGRMAIMFLMVFFIFHVLVIKPQKRKAEAQAKLVNELRKGDMVSTLAGIIGRVVTIESDAVTVEIASGVRVKFEPSSVVRRIDPQSSEKQKSAA